MADFHLPYADVMEQFGLNFLFSVHWR